MPGSREELSTSVYSVVLKPNDTVIDARKKLKDNP
jgi:hypothetical protein